MSVQAEFFSFSFVLMLNKKEKKVILLAVFCNNNLIIISETKAHMSLGSPIKMTITE